MFYSDGSLNPKYNSFKKTGTIAQIFDDHWDSVYFKFKDIIDFYRPNADSEINKIIDCYNKDLGFSIYECPECHDFVFIDNTCKSRLCSSCGYKYKMERVENILQTAYKCKHRFEAPLEAVLEFEQEDEWNGLPISTPPYTTCSKCHFEKCVPLDYHSKRGYHHIYKED